MLAVEYLKSVKMLDKAFRAVPLEIGQPCSLDYLRKAEVVQILGARPGQPLWNVDDEVLAMLAERSQVLDVPKGTVIQAQWDTATHLVLIESAQMAVIHIQGGKEGVVTKGPLGKRRKELPVAKVVGVAIPGHTLGESELLLRGTELSEHKHGVSTGCYRGTALVSRPGRIIRCLKPEFIFEDPRAHRLLANLGSMASQTLYERQTRLEHRRVEEKVLDMLELLVSVRTLVPHEGADGWRHFVPRLSVDDVARLSNCTKEMVRMALREITGRDQSGDEAVSLPADLPFGWSKGHGVLVPERTIKAVEKGGLFNSQH